MPTPTRWRRYERWWQRKGKNAEDAPVTAYKLSCLRDEADNHLIELAVAGGASVIVTKNVRDFKGAELHFPGLRILSPERLLKEI